MTLKEKLTAMLVERGLFPDQAKQIMESIITDPDNKSMSDRWSHDIEEYPEPMLKVLWLVTSTHTLNWIDENLPLASFRPLFEEE